MERGRLLSRTGDASWQPEVLWTGAAATFASDLCFLFPCIVESPIVFQFNEDYQLHGLGSTVNFLGVAQNGDYHKDSFKASVCYLR